MRSFGSEASVQLDGGDVRGSFEATVSYPNAVTHGPNVRLLRLEHRAIDGALASYEFGAAVEHAPPGCVVRNMMLWSDAQQSRLGIGWPNEGFNLRPDDGPFKTVQDVSLAANCRGDLRLAVVAVPKGGQPIVKHIAIRVT
jgi:hypothetical protein